MTTEPSPKDRFTSLDTFALVQELRSQLGAHVDKVFDAGESAFSLLFRLPGGQKTELRLVPGRYAALLPPEREHAESLSPLARELRRLLTGTVLRGVSEPGGERYLELSLQRAAEGTSIVLAVELFGTGNLVVAKDGKIVAVAHARRWAHRELRIGADYARPPSREDPWKLGAAGIEAELARSRNDLASTLAARLALGGPVAEEVIARGRWSPQAPAAQDAARVAGRLQAILSEMVAEIGAAPRGYLLLRDGVAVDATPYRSHRWEEVPGVEQAERARFSEAIAEYFATVVRPAPSPEERARKAEREELLRLASRQEQAASALRQSVLDRKADADALYAHYAEAQAALERAEAGSERLQELTIELAGRSVRVPTRRGVEGAARSLYEEAKRLSGKLEGAETALVSTRARLASAELSAPLASPSARPQAARKPRWFEKYRWFLSSEGVVVIAGRDAPSNDVVVRRHLKEGDRYIHADLQGAASVVVKRPQGATEIPPATLREAAQWAVAYSKAWRAGLASASAFWASPDQVSKSAASGEFVPKGAWVVRGTKHFERDLPLELALGTVRYEDEERWTVAPPSAVRARGVVRALLTPGPERDRSRIEEELVRELGIPRPVLQRLLPAGGLSVRRA